MLLLVVFFITSGYYGYTIWQGVWGKNIIVSVPSEPFLYVRTGWDFEDLCLDLERKGMIRNLTTFKWVAERKGYTNRVRPGKYRVASGMSNNHLINLLRSGKQEEVELVIHQPESFEAFCPWVSGKIEADSSELYIELSQKTEDKKYGINPRNWPVMILPDSYRFFWNTSATAFRERMKKEYIRYWNNENRLQKAARLGLTPAEVGILASIVQGETNLRREMPVVAGVYLNRLRKGMLLQADPTVIFAVGDRSIRRVLKEHTRYDSPYNTYKYSGLPPGPIDFPEKQCIDAVLNAKPHAYLYFCANPDFSGTHVFASSLAEHNRNAAAFQRALNRRKIFR